MSLLIEGCRPQRTRKPEKQFGRQSPSKLFRDLGINEQFQGFVTSIDEEPKVCDPKEFELIIRKSETPIPITVGTYNEKDELVLKHPEFKVNGIYYTLLSASFEDGQTLITTKQTLDNGIQRIPGVYTIPEIRKELRDLVDPKPRAWARKAVIGIRQSLHR